MNNQINELRNMNKRVNISPKDVNKLIGIVIFIVLACNFGRVIVNDSIKPPFLRKLKVLFDLACKLY